MQLHSPLLSVALTLQPSVLHSRLQQAYKARGRLSGYGPNGFLHGYKQPKYRPGPHINTILRTQARTAHSGLCGRVCVCVCLQEKEPNSGINTHKTQGPRQCGWWAYMLCILLYSRQKPLLLLLFFPPPCYFPVQLLPRCIRIIPAPPAPPTQELKITFPQMQQHQYHQQPAESQFIITRGETNPTRVRRCQQQAGIGWEGARAAS